MSGFCELGSVCRKVSVIQQDELSLNLAEAQNGVQNKASEFPREWICL